MIITFTGEKKVEGIVVNMSDNRSRIPIDLEKQFKDLNEIHYE